MQKRRFVVARFEDAARNIGTALIVAGLLGLFLDPTIGYGDVMLSVLVGFLILLFGTTEEHECTH